MVGIKVSNTFCYITELEDKKIIYDIKNQLSFFVPGYQFSKAFRTGIWNEQKKKYVYWDGKKYLITPKLRFPTGLLFIVEDTLKKYKVQYKLIDNRKPIEVGEPISVRSITPYPYQVKTVERALKEGGGVIQVATGGGKSAICCMITGMINTRTMIYVHTKDLLYQMKDNLERLLGVEVGQIGDGIMDVRKFTVATVQTAFRAYGKKYTEHSEDQRFKETLNIKKHKQEITKAVESANLIFFDECHRLIADTFQFISNKSKAARHRFALSATAFRDDECDILVNAACGKKIVNITASYLIERGFLVKPTIFMNKVPKAYRHYRDYHKAYDEYIVYNDDRNNLIIKATEMALANKRRVLILIQKLKHGELLYDLLKDKYRVVYLKGKDAAEDRRLAVDAMKDRDLDCIIASTIFDEGVDIPILDTLILAGGGKSKVRAFQRVGRVLRKYPKKKKAFVVDFMDDVTYLLKHSQERHKMYCSERLFEVKVQGSGKLV